MRTRALAAIALAAMLALLLLGCSLTGSRGSRSSRITPTPTRTLRPLLTATHMPSPLPSSTQEPTSTPLPPPTSTLPPPASPRPTKIPSEGRGQGGGAPTGSPLPRRQ